MRASIRNLLTIAAAAVLTNGMIPASAQAAMILNLSDGSDSVTLTDVDDDGAVLFVGNIGDWVLNVTLGLSDSFAGDSNSSSLLSLNSFNVSGSSRTGGNLFVRLTNTDLTVPHGDTSYSFDLGGTTSGAISFQSYVDSSNSAFGTGTLLYDTGLLTGGFSSMGGGSVNLSGPYSATTVATLTHGAGWDISGFSHSVRISEPSMLALLAIGLLAFGVAVRRRITA